MTDTDALADQIEALAAKATPSPLSDGGYYFSETCSDLTKCSHDETGYYLNDADGDLIAALWNNRETLIAAQRAAERAEQALAERDALLAEAAQIVGQIELDHRYPPTPDSMERRIERALNWLANATNAHTEGEEQ